MSAQSPKQLTLEWDLGSSFLASFQDGPTPTISLKLRDESLKDDQLYSLLLQLTERKTEFQLHAKLVKVDGEIVTFAFLPEERQRLELVLVSARGESLPYRRRRHTRIPFHFDFSVADHSGKRQVGGTTNFGAGGAHLVLDNPIACEEQVELELTLPDGAVLKLTCRVTSCIDEGPERGSSVEFLFRSASQRDTVAALVEELRPKLS